VIGTNLAFELDIGATEIGLTKADLFLLTRLVVFVEGPHEEAVLTSMFGARLLAAGIRLVPIHGTLNLPALVDSELIDALELPMAIVTDNTNAGRVRRGQPMSPEEAAVVHWTSEMQAKGITPYPLGFSQRDILRYLDDDVCRSHAPTFPGWDLAWKERPKDVQTGSGFKPWVTEHYGLDLDREAVQRLAAECARLGKIPKALDRLVLEMESLVDRWSI